jgi:cytosol alanyl aminopeptidase
MQRIWICTVFAAFWITALTATTYSADLPRLPDDVVPKAYDLAFTIDPRQKRFSGEARITVALAKPTTEFSINGRDLRVTKASLTPNGGGSIAATFREDPENPGWARITLSSAAPAGEALITIAYDAPFSTQSSGLYLKLAEDETAYAFTQMEPIDARRVFPSFDEPRFKTPFTVSVVAQSGDVVVANGPSRGTERQSGGRVRHTFATTEPLPTYLIALAVGPFDVVEAKPMPKTALRPREIPLRGITLKGKGEAFATALAYTPRFITWFEEYFAAPYPYAKLDLIAVPGKPGAMENAGAITYGERYILLSSQSTAFDVRAFAEIHAHELAHQWLGDLVTPVWWDDLWLNESFATWMSHRAAGAVMPETGMERALRDLTAQSLGYDAARSVPPIRRPLRTEQDIERAFDFVTYSKGGAVIAMVEDYVGRDRFRDGLRAHVRRFPHQNATSKDLFDSFEQATGDRQIGAIFESFINQAHAPIVTGALSCKGGPQQRATQVTYAPLALSLPEQRWTMPLCARSLGASGFGPRACSVATEREAAVPLADKACPDLVLLNNGAGYFHPAHDADGWKALTSQMNRLPPDEQRVAIDGARSAFASNAIQPPAFLDIVERTAASTDTAVLANAMGHVARLEVSVPDDGATAYRAWVRSTLAAPFDRTVKQRGTQDLAVALMRTLAVNGRDPTLRARLGEAGRSMIGGSFELPMLRSSLPRDLAMRVAIEDGGPELFATLLQSVQSSRDLLYRWDALRALGHTPRAEDRAKLAEALKSMKGFEITFVLFELSGDPTTAAFIWDVAKAQVDGLIARDAAFAQHIALFARGLCTTEARADVVAFMAANKAKLKENETTTSRSLDAIDHCVALRAVQGPPLAKALRARETKVATRRLREPQPATLTLMFDQLATVPEQRPSFGDVIATCGRKFPAAVSPLEICAAGDGPAACRDIRLMEQCTRP